MSPKHPIYVDSQGTAIEGICSRAAGHDGPCNGLPRVMFADVCCFEYGGAKSLVAALGYVARRRTTGPLPPKEVVVIRHDDTAAALAYSMSADKSRSTKPGLPTDDKTRKSLPIFDGCIMYFPDALLSVAEVSRIGNDQHNPGQPLHWSRDKSTDHFNTAQRHLIDHKLGVRRDVDGGRHLAKAAWRVLAALQTDIENERAGK